MRKPEVLADTNVVSYLLLGGPLADDYRQLLAEMSVSVSFVTVGEMQFGAEIRCWSDARRNGLDRFLEDYPVAGYAIGMEKTYARSLLTAGALAVLSIGAMPGFVPRRCGSVCL